MCKTNHTNEHKQKGWKRKCQIVITIGVTPLLHSFKTFAVIFFLLVITDPASLPTINCIFCLWQSYILRYQSRSLGAGGCDAQELHGWRRRRRVSPLPLPSTKWARLWIVSVKIIAIRTLLSLLFDSCLYPTSCRHQQAWSQSFWLVNSSLTEPGWPSSNRLWLEPKVCIPSANGSTPTGDARYREIVRAQTPSS